MASFAVSKFRFEPSWSSKFDYARMRDPEAIASIRAMLEDVEGYDELATMVYKSYLIATNLQAEESANFRKETLPFLQKMYDNSPENSDQRPYCAVLLHYCLASAIVNPSPGETVSNPYSEWMKSVEPLRYAASRNIAHAFYRLGDIAASGIISEDRDGDYYREGAELGHLPSYMALGLLHLEDPFQKSNEKARYYYELAANLGFDLARRHLEALDKENDSKRMDRSEERSSNNDRDDEEDDDYVQKQRKLDEKYTAEAQLAIDAVLTHRLRFDFAGTWELFENARSGNWTMVDLLSEKRQDAELHLEKKVDDMALQLEVMVYRAYVASCVDREDRNFRDQVFPFLKTVFDELPSDLSMAKTMNWEFNPDRKYYAILLHYCYHDDWRFRCSYEKLTAKNGFSAIDPLHAVIAQDKEINEDQAGNPNYDDLAYATSGHALCALAKSNLYATNFDSPNYEAGLKYMKEAANQFGDVEACLLLGQIFQNGDYGHEPSTEEAKRLFMAGVQRREKAEKLGMLQFVSACMNSLGILLMNAGESDQALYFYRRLAEDFNDASTMYMLGEAYWQDNSYLSSIVPTKDLTKAAYLLRAAHDGQAEAQSSLGSLYCDEKKDYENGLKWLLAAKANAAYGVQDKLEQLYDQGIIPRPKE